MPARPLQAPLRGITGTLTTYFSGINNGQFWSAYTTFSPALRTRLSEKSFADGDSTSYDSGIQVLAIRRTGPDRARAAVTFTSRQASDKGPNGDPCDIWHLAYHMVNIGGVWYINDTSPFGGPAYSSCDNTLPPRARPRHTAAPSPSCYPLTDGGNCYEPGEYCRASDAGMSGVAGDGERIICRDNNGLRWEPV